MSGPAETSGADDQPGAGGTDWLRQQLQRSVADVEAGVDLEQRARAAGVRRWRHRRRARGVGVVAAAALAASAVFVGVRVASTRTAPQQVQVTAGRSPGAAKPSAPTLAGNLRLARLAAARLLAQVHLPQGTQRTGRPVPALSGPLGGAALGGFDIVRTWVVGQPYARVLAEIDAHRLHGSIEEAGATETVNGTVVSPPSGGYVLFGAPAEAWSEIDLSVAAGADGTDRTGIRADVDFVVLDPRPERDTTPEASRVRVTVAGGCPGSVASRLDVTASAPALTNTLLPAEPAIDGLLCGYGSRLQLTASRRLLPAKALRLATEVAAVPLSHPYIPQPYSNPGGCSITAGEDWILVFAYRGRPDVDLWLHPGCGTALDNGSIVADQDGDLSRLGSPPQARTARQQSERIGSSTTSRPAVSGVVATAAST